MIQHTLYDYIIFKYPYECVMRCERQSINKYNEGFLSIPKLTWEMLIIAFMVVVTIMQSLYQISRDHLKTIIW